MASAVAASLLAVPPLRTVSMTATAIRFKPKSEALILQILSPALVAALPRPCWPADSR